MIVAQISHCCIDDAQPELTGGSEAVRDEKVLAGSLEVLPGDDGWCRRLFTGCFYVPQNTFWRTFASPLANSDPNGQISLTGLLFFPKL